MSSVVGSPTSKSGRIRVGVVGIGRVGLPLAAVLSKHFDTVGVDVDPAVVDRVNSRSAFAEPKLADYISRYNLRASSDFSELEDCQVVFVCVGSQVPGKGYSSGRFLSALRETLPHITRKEQLLVISTTLPPLELKEEVIPLLASEKLEERAMGYCYNPAMVALGRAVSDFENPSFLMIGESNQDAGTGLESLWRTVVPQGIRVFRRRVIDIAVAKYALNVALVLKISLLSYLTEFCEKEESDIDVVTEILRAEPRVAGPKMFKGGLGYGGTCYPVDIEAARNEGERLGIPGFFPEALQELNDWQVERTVELVSRLGKKKVAVLGLSFKPDTDVVVGSQSMMIAEKLSRGGYDVMVFDPMAMNNAKAVLGGNVRYASSLKEAIEFGDVVFFGVEWPEFGRLGAKDFRKDQVVIDPWRLLRENPPPGRYVPYGTTA